MECRSQAVAQYMSKISRLLAASAVPLGFAVLRTAKFVVVFHSFHPLKKDTAMQIWNMYLNRALELKGKDMVVAKFVVLEGLL